MASWWSAGTQEGYEDCHWAKCDGCEQQNFKGDRFDCNSCDAIFCESCILEENYGDKTEHSDFHSCRVTLCPLDRHVLPKQWATCSGCSSENFAGVGYKCKQCDNYMLCRSCHDTGCYAPHENTTVEHAEDHEVEEIQPVCDDSLNWQRIFASATKFQQTVGPTQIDNKHTYHEWNEDEWYTLGRKLGYALYGLPTINAEESNESTFGYTKEQEQRIFDLRGHMLWWNKHHGGGVEVALEFIFISYFEPGKFEGTMPLFKLNTNGPVYFVEPSKRNYNGWGDFVENNHLPPCWMLCPSNGTYTEDDEGRICLEQRTSANCKPDRRALEVGDKVATGGAVFGTALAVVGLFTPLAPVAAGALLTTGLTTGAWFTGRATAQLVDRGTHGQRIDPFADRECFFSWLSLVGTVASFGSSLAVSRLAEVAREGVVIGSGTRFLANVAIFGSLGINGLGCISSLWSLVDDLNKGHTPSALQIFQLSAQLLFFTNAVYSVQQAKTIIENATKNELTALRNGLGTKEERTRVKRMINRHKTKFGRETGGQVTLKHLKGLQMKNQAGGDAKLGTATQRHAHFDKENMQQTGQAHNMEEAAASMAETARTTRYGGRQSGMRSKTTILAVDPETLQHKINEAIQPTQRNGRHDVKVSGTYQAWEFRFDPATRKTVKAYVQVKDPVFGVTNGRANHFHAQKTGAMIDISPKEFYDVYQPIERPTPIFHRFFPPKPARRDNEHDE